MEPFSFNSYREPTTDQQKDIRQATASPHLAGSQVATRITRKIHERNGGEDDLDNGDYNRELEYGDNDEDDNKMVKDLIREAKLYDPDVADHILLTPARPHRSQKLAIHTTISDDRSVGSQPETTGQKLVALKARENKPSRIRLQDLQELPPPTPSTRLHTLAAICNEIDRLLKELPKDSSSEYVKYRNVLYRAPLIVKNDGAEREDSLSKQLQQDCRDHGSSGLPSSLLYVDSNALRNPETVTGSFEAPRAHTSELEQKTKLLKGKERARGPPNYQIIHRINGQGENSSTYFDPPQWSLGENNSRALQSNLPIPNISSYMDRHQDLAFIVYRDYDTAATRDVNPENSDRESDIIAPVQPTSESIVPATKELSYSIKKLLGSNKNSVKERDLLLAPYFVIYHSQNTMGDFLERLADQQRRQFQLLLDYVLSAYANEYSNVDALLQRHKITYPYIEYLFEPGDVLVQGKDRDVRGFLSKSWLTKSPPKSSWPIEPSKEKSPKTTWGVEVWSWEFDGVFSRQTQRLSMEMNSRNLSERDIDDLKVRPLTYASKDVVDLLRRRGEMCRIRRFVSYHEDMGRDFHRSGDERYMIDLPMGTLFTYSLRRSKG